MACLLRHGVETVGATRRAPRKPNTIPLDLSRDPREWEIPAGTQVVVNCAAITGSAACQRGSDDARKVNCENVAALARRSANESRSFVHISTDRVFSGRTPRAAAGSEFAPIDEYGRQKAAADQRLLTLIDEGASVAIVRLTKVVSQVSAPFAEWRETLRKGDFVHPFLNVVIAPISLDFAVEVLQKVIVEGRTGVFQASAEIDVTYAEFAHDLAEACGAPRERVVPISKASTRFGTGEAARFASLDISRVRDELKMTPQSPRQLAQWVAASSAPHLAMPKVATTASEPKP